MKRRIVATAIAINLTVLVGFFWAKYPFLSLEFNEPSNYAQAGEAIIHDIAPWYWNTFRLQLANIAAGLIFYHSGISPQAWAHIFFLAQGALIFTAGSLLGSGPWRPMLMASLYFIIPESRHLQYPQSLFSILLLLVVNFLVIWARSASYANTLLLALSIGATFLFRSTLAFLPPILAVFNWLLSSPKARSSRQKRLWIIGLLPYIFLIPTLKLNWSLHHKLIPFENGAASYNIVVGALGLVIAANGTISSLIGDPSVDLQNTSEVFAWALAQIYSHPFRYLGAVARRLAHVVSFHPALWFLAGLSLWLHRKKNEYLVLGILLLYLPAVLCLMSIQPDYLIPIWPLLCILAAAPALYFLRDSPQKVRPGTGIFEFLPKACLAFVLALCLYTSWKIIFPRNADCSDDACLEAALSRALLAYPDDAWLLVQRGELRLRQGRTSEVVTDLVKARALGPRNEQAEIHLAGARVTQGDTSEVFSLRLPGAADDNSSGLSVERVFQAYILRARVHLGRGEPAKASEMLTAALIWRRRQLGIFSQTGAETEYEREILRKLLILPDAHFANDCAEAARYWPLKDRISLLNAVTRMIPPDCTMRLRQAEASLDSGDKKSAVRFLQAALALKPSSEQRSQIMEAYRKIHERRIDKPVAAAAPARPPLRTPEAPRPASRRNWRRITDAYASINEHRLALDVLRELLRSSPQVSEMWIAQARFAIACGERSLAIESLSRAHELKPGADQRQQIAQIYQDLREYRRALEILRNLSLEQPGRAGVFADMGVCEYLSGEPDRGISNLNHALKLAPDMLSAYSSLGFIHAARKDLNLALQVYDRALARPPRAVTRKERELIAGSRRELLHRLKAP